MDNIALESYIFTALNQHILGLKGSILQTKEGPIEMIDKISLAEAACNLMTELSEVLADDTND